MSEETSQSVLADEVNDPELIAMAKVVAALKNLDPDAQQNVIDWVVRRLKLKNPSGGRSEAADRGVLLGRGDFETISKRREEEQEEREPEQDDVQDDALEGVNVVAQKWIRRSGLSAEQISHLFSLGVDDIDVVARSVPGKTAKERFRNVVLLQGVAAYLGAGTPRTDAAKLRQSAVHYDADPTRNFATYMRDFSAEVSGSTATGFTLTSRGLNAAKDLIKELTESKKAAS